MHWYSNLSITLKQNKITRICETPEVVFKKSLVCYLTKMEIKLIYYSYSLREYEVKFPVSLVYSHTSSFLAFPRNRASSPTCAVCISVCVCAHPHAECRAHTAHLHPACWLKIQTCEHWGCSKEKSQMWREVWIRSRGVSSSQGLNQTC